MRPISSPTQQASLLALWRNTFIGPTSLTARLSLIKTNDETRYRAEAKHPPQGSPPDCTRVHCLSVGYAYQNRARSHMQAHVIHTRIHGVVGIISRQGA